MNLRKIQRLLVGEGFKQTAEGVYECRDLLGNRYAFVKRLIKKNGFKFKVKGVVDKDGRPLLTDRFVIKMADGHYRIRTSRNRKSEGYWITYVVFDDPDVNYDASAYTRIIEDAKTKRPP